MVPKPREPHSIIYRIVKRPGPGGLPENHRVIECCQERHEWKFVNDGYTVAWRDSEIMPPEPIEPAQSNPRREDDGA
jgi:hypothetical protein